MLGYCEGPSAVCPEAVENGTADSPGFDSPNVQLGTADNPREASGPGRLWRDVHGVLVCDGDREPKSGASRLWPIRKRGGQDGWPATEYSRSAIPASDKVDMRKVFRTQVTDAGFTRSRDQRPNVEPGPGPLPLRNRYEHESTAR
jgi:hypothetical protein